MANKVLYYKVVGTIYSSPNVELAAGDEATVFLDQTRVPSLPVSITGIVQAVADTNILQPGGCVAPGHAYTIEYDDAQLEGAAITSISQCEVLEIAGTSCCEQLREALDEEIAARTAADTAIQAQLDEWNVIELSAEPEAGVTGVQQVELNTVTGPASGTGNFEVTFTATGLTGSPLTLLVPVIAGDSESVIAQKIAIAAAANANLNAFFEFDNIGADVAATFRVAADNQPGANMGFGPFGGVASTTLTAGVAPVAGTVPERVGQHAQWGTRIWEATSVSPAQWTEITTEYVTANYSNAITALTGAGGLDELEVSAEDEGRIQAVRVSGLLYFYELTAGTDAESSPTVIRPDNYDSPDNEFVWKLKAAATLSAAVLDASTGGNGADDDSLLVKFDANGGLTGTLRVAAIAPDNIDQGIELSANTGGAVRIRFVRPTGEIRVQAPATVVGGTKTVTLPDFTGTLGLQRAVAASTPVSGFAIVAGSYIDQIVSLNPAGTLATGTLSLPASANSRAGQHVVLFSTQTITALTVDVSGGGTIRGTAVTTLAANGSYEFFCETPGTWIRTQ